MSKDYQRKYKYAFRFDENQLEYDFFIKKRRSFWWLLWFLLLLLPLLLLVQCKRDVTVDVLYSKGKPVPNASVTLHYSEFQVYKNGEFLYRNDSVIIAESDNYGELVLKDMPFSMYDWLFHHGKEFHIHASKCYQEADSSYRFYGPDDDLPYCIFLGGIRVHVLDAETEDDIPFAEISWASPYGQRLVTDDHGDAILPNIKISDILSELQVKAEGYADTLFAKLDVESLYTKDSVIEIRLRPIDVAFNSDVVICVDNTGSMDKMLNAIKSNVLNFYTDISNYCSQHGKKVGEIRLKLIVFGDCEEGPIHTTKFYHLPDESNLLSDTANIIFNKAQGGNEAALEALYFAVNSDWVMSGTRKRQVILMFTDEQPDNWGYTREYYYYPHNVPKSFDEVTALWRRMDARTKRLVLFEAEEDRSSSKSEMSWIELTHLWGDGVIYKTGGLDFLLQSSGSLAYQEVLKLICESF